MKENLSKNERDFVLESLDKSQRIDGRGMFDIRGIEITFGKSYGMVEVQLGKTRVYTAITYEIVEPKPERPNEGFYIFNTNISPMSNVLVDPSRPNQSSESELGRIIEKGLKESRAIDTEALCIISGSKVWSIKVSIHVLDDCGNILDCASISVITALVHFRKPDITVIGNEATVHPMDEREPVPLSIHHSPISITFGFFPNNVMVVDPYTKEESVMDGKISFLVNIHKEICGIQKSSGTSTTIPQVIKCSKIAVLKASEITLLIKERLHQDIKQRQPNVVKRKPIEQLEIMDHTKREYISNNNNNNNNNNHIQTSQPSKSFEIKVENKFNNQTNEFNKNQVDKLINNINTSEIIEKEIQVKIEPTDDVEMKDIISNNNYNISNNKNGKKNKMDSDSDSDSEEEETVTLQPEQLKTNKSIKPQPTKSFIPEEESEDLSVALLKKKKPAAKKPAAKK
ncbi:putative exosome complex exonuclease [Tieghemostelium lacteum]|uniref:Exosome complex component RRP45 n=1 Tax=Tieghemostelium lacteum TaxID=361077 RepID=A0A152A3D2_TIELA|nr:putative exosome complex exonuclease [Tieghemostelium lacteum]|eukprot:KYR00615.1 putative exosome complex exonuclease [Tieghemostelium lacteum]